MTEGLKRVLLKFWPTHLIWFWVGNIQARTIKSGKCKLCLAKEADCTGSHIVPSFLLAGLNIEGVKGRNKEFTFSSLDSTIKRFIGQDVTPEQIRERLGRELEDDEIEEQENELILDHVICNSCEKRLSVLESEYSKYHILKEEKDEEVIETGSDTRLSCIFWVSILWRISAWNFRNGSLGMNEERSLRFYLDKYLDEKRKNLMTNIGIGFPFWQKFRYSLIYSCLPVKRTNQYVSAIPNNNPKVVLLNRYTLFYFHNKRFVQPEDGFAFGFENFVDPKIENSTRGNNERAILISEEQNKPVITRIIQKWVDNYKKGLKRICELTFNEFYDQELPEDVFELVLNRVVHEDETITFNDRYLEGRVSNIVYEEIVEKLWATYKG